MKKYSLLFVGVLIGAGFGSVAGAHPEEECPPCECEAAEEAEAVEAPPARQSIQEALKLIERAEQEER